MSSSSLGRSILTAALAAACSGCFSNGDEKPEPKNLVKDPTLGELELLQNAKSTYDQGLYSVSQKSWAELRDGYPASYYAPLAELKSADAFFYAAAFGSAIVAYQEFLRLHPGHEAVPYVRYQIARANFEQYKGISHDQSPLLAAIKAYSELIEKNGGSDYAVRGRRELDRCKELHAEHIALVARFYDKMGLTEASENRLAVLEGQFPSSKAARELELESQSGRPLPPHATKEQPQPPRVISEENHSSVTPGLINKEEGSDALEMAESITGHAGDIPEAANAQDSNGAAAKHTQSIAETQNEKPQTATPEDGSFLSGLTCASASGRVVITARTKGAVEPVKLKKEQGRHITVSAFEAGGGSGTRRPDSRKATCSAGPINAVATEEGIGKRRSIKLALSSLEPMRFYVLNPGTPLQIAAVPLNR